MNNLIIIRNLEFQLHKIEITKLYYDVSLNNLISLIKLQATSISAKRQHRISNVINMPYVIK